MNSSAESDTELLQIARSQALLFGPFLQPLYRVSGSDAERYLHGRVTQNVKALIPGHGAKSLVLTPQGKIQGQFILLREEKTYLLLSDAVQSEPSFREALLQFKVADDVQLEDLSSRFKVFIALGPETGEMFAESADLGSEAFSHASLAEFGAVLFRYPFGALPGLGFLVPNENEERLITSLALPAGNERVFETLRILAEIPRMDVDLSEKVLAPEIDLEALAAFDKGCYAGQEVVEMATARGRPNRMLLLLKGEAATAPPAGSEIFSAKDPGKACGFVSSSCLLAAEAQAWCLAFLKTSAAEDGMFQCNGSSFSRVRS